MTTWRDRGHRPGQADGGVSQAGNRARGRLDRLASEITADRAALLRIMTTLGIAVRGYKVFAAWAGERAGRLKLNGHLVARSPASATGGGRITAWAWTARPPGSARCVPLSEAWVTAASALAGLERRIRRGSAWCHGSRRRRLRRPGMRSCPGTSSGPWNPPAPWTVWSARRSARRGCCVPAGSATRCTGGAQTPATPRYSPRPRSAPGYQPACSMPGPAVPGAPAASRRLVLAGLAAALPAALAGSVDWSELHEQQMRVGVVHAFANTAAVALYAASLAAPDSAARAGLREDGSEPAQIFLNKYLVEILRGFSSAFLRHGLGCRNTDGSR